MFTCPGKRYRLCSFRPRALRGAVRRRRQGIRTGPGDWRVERLRPDLLGLGTDPRDRSDCRSPRRRQPGVQRVRHHHAERRQRQPAALLGAFIRRLLDPWPNKIHLQSFRLGERPLTSASLSLTFDLGVAKFDLGLGKFDLWLCVCHQVWPWSC